MNKEQYMEDLVKDLNEAARVYEQGEDEIMSNFEYDAKYDELLALEKELGKILPNSPSQRAGYEILSELKKETHPYPMLSLDKTKLVDDLVKFITKVYDEVNGKKYKAFLSWKLDGLTVVLTYINGKLEKAVTRGNGKIGEVITKNAKYFKGVPKNISFKGKLVIRGEAIIGYSDFNRINDNRNPNSEPYKNPRNLASGTVRQLNTRITASRNVQFKPFQLVSIDDENGNSLEKDYNSYSGRLDFLKTLGFTPVEGFLIDANEIPEKVEWFSNAIKTNDFPSNGLVLVIDDVEFGLSLGITSKYPRYGIAFKWKDETEETILRDVEWSASRTGLLNPVAIFDTVEIEGTSVSRASIHNISYIKEKKLGIGDRITVYKANMIIPQIADNLTNSDDIQIPETCPCCGSKTKIIKNLNPSTNKWVEVLSCPNEDCPAKKIGSFEQFVSRDAMNIVGLSTATIERLIESGLIKTFVDFYTLEEKQEEIKQIRANLFEEMLNIHQIELDDETRKTFKKDTLNYSLMSYMMESSFKYDIQDYFAKHQNEKEYTDRMTFLHSKTSELSDLVISNWDGMGEKSYQKIVKAIQNSRKVPIARFIYALGISGIGKANANLVCKFFNNNIDKIMNVTYDELIEVDGFGDVMSKDFVDYFSNPSNIALVKELLNYVTLENPNVSVGSKFKDLTFVLSGSLPSGKASLEELIKDNGGKVSSSVSKKTSYLVAGDGSGSKSEKANSLGVPIITEDDLKNMLN